MGQKAQTHMLQSNIASSNLWAFCQANTIRKIVMEAFADKVDIMQLGQSDPAVKKDMQEGVAKWRTPSTVRRSRLGR